MATVNIPSTVDDPNYRYVMPKLEAKKESRGTGAKTCIGNMSDVARALHRPPEYITKWFQAALAAQVNYTNKEGEGERAIIRGHHDTHVLQTQLDGFIMKYVCCKKCHLPEMSMKVNKKGVIGGVCRACDWAGDLDNDHKLAAFISKNPPAPDPDESGHGLQVQDASGGKQDKKALRAAKAARKVAGHEDEGERRENEKKEKKEKKKKKDKKDTKEKKDDSDETTAVEIDGEGDSEDKEVQDLDYNDEDTKDVVSNVRAFVEKSACKLKVDDLFQEVRMMQLAKVFNHKVRLYIVFEALCGTSMNAEGLEAQTEAIDEFIGNANMKTAEVCWALGAYYAANPDSTKSVPKVLKVCFDEDWLEEKPLLKYYNEDEGKGEPGFAAVKEKAAPFLKALSKWLEEAETSEDDQRG